MVSTTAEASAPIDRTALRSMAKKIDELPLLPQVLVRILQLDIKADDFFEQFEHLSKQDPGLAVRVVSLANSAASAPATPISTIKNAITRMGARTIADLVASLGVQRVFMPTQPGQVRLWTHSVEVAVATRQIARLLPQLQVDLGHAYLLGLLHDIGRFVMLEHAAPALLKVDESHWHSPDELIESDIAVYKFTHSELGYLACLHWGLPQAIADVVRVHHDPLPGTFANGSLEAATFCVQIADRLCVSLIANQDLDDMTEADIEERIGADCLRTEEERAILSETVLCKNVRTICAQSDQLLAGLGFSR